MRYATGISRNQQNAGSITGSRKINRYLNFAFSKSTAMNPAITKSQYSDKASVKLHDITAFQCKKRLDVSVLCDLRTPTQQSVLVLMFLWEPTLPLLLC
ncbi:hypothetical protein GJ496_000666 [Pomphorhynchus laevis]|nr:hypothetical protein GJ496_000666 [Pomphorhynchus laevis]